MYETRKIRLIMELRQHGITDQAVLSAIERVPRDAFIPESFRDQAYENTALPIGNGQTISQPAVVGFMTQSIELNSRMKILEIGTGCGYQAAVLARLCRRVYSIERFLELTREANARFQNLRIHNVTTKWGDGYKGWPEQGLFDRIILTAATSEVPSDLFDQMAQNSILIAPIINTNGEQTLVKYFRKNGGNWNSKKLWDVRFVPLVQGKVSNGEIQ